MPAVSATNESEDPWWWSSTTEPSSSSSPASTSPPRRTTTRRPVDAAVLVPDELDSSAATPLLLLPFQHTHQYALVHEVADDEHVQVAITGFDFLLHNHHHASTDQLVVCVSLVLGECYCTQAASTVCSTSSASTRLARWPSESVLTLPYSLCDLPRDAQLEFTVLGPASSNGGDGIATLGRARFALFAKHTGVLRVGKQELAVGGDNNNNNNNNELAYELEEQVRRKISSSSSSWLDRMADERVMQVRRQRRRQMQGGGGVVVGVLAIELPCYDDAVLVWEPPPAASSTSTPDEATTVFRRRAPDGLFPELSQVRREEEMPNVVEEKLYLMRRSLTRKGDTGDDQPLAPNHREWKQIDLVLSNNTGSKPRNEDEDLLWKFRYSLVRDSRALTKVLASVKWDSEDEVRQVEKLLARWEAVLFSDVLRLLSGEITEHPTVRAYAVKVLANSQNSTLKLYLPQLVQALRHDRVSVDKETSQGPLQRFLIQKCSQDDELASSLHWLLKVEMLLARPAKMMGGGGGGLSPFPQCFANYHQYLKEQHQQGGESTHVYARIKRQDEFVTHFMNAAGELMHLGVAAGAGGAAGAASSTTALDSTGGGVFALLSGSSADARRMRQCVSGLESYPFSVSSESATGEHTPRSHHQKEPVTLTGFPHGAFVGVRKRSVKVLSSTTAPTVVDFLFEEEDGNSKSSETIRLMFKVGDDVRQDQLVLQLIDLMDGLFKNNGLDLEMTVYRVLAVGPKQGVIEFVSNAVPLSTVSREYKTISNFLLQCNNPALYATVLDKFIRSCAGYTVVTYVLGIGDRHLDNILILPNGRVFHIDFGYSFGRDKRLATPVRLTADMLDTMGREGEIKFRQLCWEAYKSLRAEAALILSVVGLMGDAGIPDLQHTAAALAGMQDRLKIHVSDEEAERSLNHMITQAASALGPQFIEYMHALGQSSRGGGGGGGGGE